MKHFFRFDEEQSKLLVRCGMAAGFSGLFGTPIAATLFVFEVVRIGQIQLYGLIWVFASSWISFFIYELWSLPHTHYPVSSPVQYSPEFFCCCVLAGVVFGLAFRLFHLTGQVFKDLFSYFKLNDYITVAIGSLIVVLATISIDDFQYLGLGLQSIKQSFIEPASWEVFLLKLFFTSMCLTIGFKGGEVTPLFFMGATLGSFLSTILPIPTDTLAAMGFMSVFAAAANTPISCIIMGVELFGNPIMMPLSVACLVAFAVSGKSGIYSSQEIKYPKW